MKKMPFVVGLCAVTLSVGLTGCSTSTTETESAATSAAATASPATSGLAVPDLPTGPNRTIADYVNENKIIEAPVKQGDADSPTFDFPLPPDWKPAGAKTPEWAYGAIIYDKAKDPADPPFITAIVSRLSGDVDAAKILEYAPGMLQNLPGYQRDGDVEKDSLGGFDGTVFQGSYLRDNMRRYIAQKTIIIPGKDGALFVLQLNADAPEGQEQVIRDAAEAIDEGTTITA